jgi:hypothetical protein
LGFPQELFAKELHRGLRYGGMRDHSRLTRPLESGGMLAARFSFGAGFWTVLCLLAAVFKCSK